MKVFDEKLESLHPYEKLNESDKKKLFCERRHINSFIKKDDSIYHVRKTELDCILNELLGELVSEYFLLPTVKSVLYRGDYTSYCLLNELFTSEDKKYSDIRLFVDYEMKRNNIDLIDKMDRIYDKENNRIYSIKKECYNSVVLKLKKLIIRDFITSTNDRYIGNLMFVYDKSFVDMMPVYDYEYSFDYGMCWAYTDIFVYFFNDKKIVEYFRKDDTLQELLEKAMMLKIKDIIKKLEDEYPIKLSSSNKKRYDSVVKKRQDEIKQYKLIR